MSIYLQGPDALYTDLKALESSYSLPDVQFHFHIALSPEHAAWFPESVNLTSSQPGLISWLCFPPDDLARGSELNTQATNVFKTAMENLDTNKRYERQRSMLPNMIPKIVPLVPGIPAT
jgi:hypothetical protein